MLSRKISVLVLALMSSVTIEANSYLFGNHFRDDIFEDMKNMQEQMDYIFDRVNQRVQSHDNLIPLNSIRGNRVSNMNSFVDRGDRYEIHTDIPESKENQIDINAKDGVLSIEATVTKVEEIRKPNSISHSRYTQSYNENIALPKDADISTMKIDYQDKKLIITINKNNQTKETPKVETSKEPEKTISPKESNTTTKENNTTK